MYIPSLFFPLDMYIGQKPWEFFNYNMEVYLFTRDEKKIVWFT